MSEKKAFTDGRLGKKPASKMQEYMTKPWILRERSRLQYNAVIDLAFAVMLTEQKIISKEHGSALLVALQELEQLGPEGFPLDTEYGSILFNIQAWLDTKVGPDIAGRLHTGRGRADYGAAILTLHSRDAVLKTMQAVVDFEQIVLDLAEKHADTLMPGYTHLQQSQPTTYGHYLLSQYFPFERDFHRLNGVYERNNLCPLGSPARSGTSWPIDRRRVAALLGYSDISLNTQDLPYYRRDHMADLAAAFSLLMSNLGRLATDIDQWTAMEFGFVEMADEYSGSSSIMPQKKNPYPLEFIRGLAGEAIGWVPGVMGVLKAAHTSAADPEFVPIHNGGIGDQGSTTCVQMLDLMGEVLKTLYIYPDNMKSLAREGWSTASHLTDVLALEGNIPFRESHRVVARLVRLAVQQGRKPYEVDAELLKEAASQMNVPIPEMDTATVQRHLDPEEFIRTRVTEGSQHPDETRRVIGMARERLATQRKELGALQQAVADSDAELRRAIRSILG